VEGNNDIQNRETKRRRALWRLAGLTPGDPAGLELIQVLDEIDQAELNDTPLITKILNEQEVMASVRVEPHASTLSIVRIQTIPEPWRARFLAASIGSTRVAEGFYAHDWHSFLRGWQLEMAHLERHKMAGLAPTKPDTNSPLN
jgi:hypothetical protein